MGEREQKAEEGDGEQEGERTRTALRTLKGKEMWVGSDRDGEERRDMCREADTHGQNDGGSDRDGRVYHDHKEVKER